MDVTITAKVLAVSSHVNHVRMLCCVAGCGVVHQLAARGVLCHRLGARYRVIIDLVVLPQLWDGRELC